MTRTLTKKACAPTMDTPYADGTWTSADGLKLYYRDYPGREDRPPVLCLHGLTRNARDFAALAAHLAGAWRVIVPDFRGRGQSDYAKDSASYTPATYAADIEALLATLGIERFVAIGTSLGGLVAMILAAAHPDRIAGAVLNDVGPELEAAGLARIREYVGQGRSFPTWMHAARAMQETQGKAHPGFALEDWLATAKRCCVLGQNGRIAFDYDMTIGEPLSAPSGEEGGDAEAGLWPLFEALAGRPVLSIRGELSDVLSAQTVAAMAARLPELECVTVPDTGHAPLLVEPEALQAIERLLARVE